VARSSELGAARRGYGASGRARGYGEREREPTEKENKRTSEGRLAAAAVAPSCRSGGRRRGIRGVRKASSSKDPPGISCCVPATDVWSGRAGDRVVARNPVGLISDHRRAAPPTVRASRRSSLEPPLTCPSIPSKFLPSPDLLHRGPRRHYLRNACARGAQLKVYSRLLATPQPCKAAPTIALFSRSLALVGFSPNPIRTARFFNDLLKVRPSQPSPPPPTRREKRLARY
jgi:hypothetical protein